MPELEFLYDESIAGQDRIEQLLNEHPRRRLRRRRRSDADPMTTTSPEIARIVDAIRARQRFVLSSHSRPDGDSIGSQLAMAYALRALGKEVTRRQRRPGAAAADGVSRRAATSGSRRRVDGDFDAAIIMECGDLARTGVAGLDRFFVINIDHHPGNTGYGQINWFDATRRRLRRDGVRPGAARSACR